jgi:hypothetical protein
MRWMSPELFDSEGHRRTKYSDCYALGMVIYEVLTRRVPFYRYTDFAIVGRVIKGERPERPQESEGAVGFTDAVWEVLELCWKSLPRERPSIEDVLKCMKKAATSWTPPSPLSMAVPSAVDSPTSNTSIVASEESDDVLSLPSQSSDEFSAPYEPPNHQIPQPRATRSKVTNLTVRILRLVSACCIDDLHFSSICSLFLRSFPGLVTP